MKSIVKIKRAKRNTIKTLINMGVLYKDKNGFHVCAPGNYTLNK